MITEKNLQSSSSPSFITDNFANLANINEQDKPETTKKTENLFNNFNFDSSVINSSSQSFHSRFSLPISMHEDPDDPFQDLPEISFDNPNCSHSSTFPSLETIAKMDSFFSSSANSSNLPFLDSISSSFSTSSSSTSLSLISDSSSSSSTISNSSCYSSSSSASRSVTSQSPSKPANQEAFNDIKILFDRMIKIAEKIGLDSRGRFSWVAAEQEYNETYTDKSLSSEVLRYKLSKLMKSYLRTVNLPKNKVFVCKFKKKYQNKNEKNKLEKKIKAIAGSMTLLSKKRVPWKRLADKYNIQKEPSDPALNNEQLRRSLQHSIKRIRNSFKKCDEGLKPKSKKRKMIHSKKTDSSTKSKKRLTEEMNKICEIARNTVPTTKFVPWEELFKAYNLAVPPSQRFTTAKEFQNKFYHRKKEIQKNLKFVPLESDSLSENNGLISCS